ncbi:MAG: hypothetical protein RJA07_2414 [Bacteroidota bacterium]|jgi:heme/copper-type cytochrome/quinol oxidase subunit 3
MLKQLAIFKISTVLLSLQSMLFMFALIYKSEHLDFNVKPVFIAGFVLAIAFSIGRKFYVPYFIKQFENKK